MDELGNSNSGDTDINEPIPFDDTSNVNVSHSPLNLGDSSVIESPTAESAPHPMEAVAEKPSVKMVSSDRITGVRTFFTKLHVGAIDFLDSQITNWLKDNPGITIKRTNTATGMVQGKKTEPNIIVTVWY